MQIVPYFHNQFYEYKYLQYLFLANSTEKSKNSTEANTEHVDDKNTIGHIGQNTTADHAKNYTDNIHAYVNVMRNILAPQVSNPLHSTGICSSYTEFIVVVILTTFVNFFVFVLISLFCRFV